jgi:hypothetical protein
MAAYFYTASGWRESLTFGCPRQSTGLMIGDYRRVLLSLLPREHLGHG